MAWPFTGKTPERVVSFYNFTNSTLSGTCSGSSTPCIFGKLIVNGGTTGSLTIRDSTSASGGTVIATIGTPVTGAQYEYNVHCETGLSVYASAATNFTLTYLR